MIKIEYAHVHTLLKVSIAPDGRVLHHQSLSPNWRSIDKERLQLALYDFREGVKEPCVSQALKDGGDLMIRIDGSGKEIVGVDIDDC